MTNKCYKCKVDYDDEYRELYFYSCGYCDEAPMCELCSEYHHVHIIGKGVEMELLTNFICNKKECLLKAYDQKKKFTMKSSS